MGSITVQGLDRLKANLQSEKLYRKAVRSMLVRLNTRARNIVRSATPRDTGEAAGSVRGKTRGASSVAVTVGATHSSQKYRNYRYWRRHAYDRKSRHFGWLERAKEQVRGAVAAEVAKLAREVEAGWRR